jgi:murein DD-endopeptidase MepM/ murein hydrolase activator NlpD
MADWLLKLGSKDTAKTHRVVDSQWLLSGHNAFGHAWYHGELDGIVGPQTAHAYQQCKYDIGYQASAVEPNYGPVLRAFLMGEKDTTADMKRRARQRKSKFIWPTQPKGKLIGFPGMGTHSYTSAPNNWESDNAYDIWVPRGSHVIASADGVIGSSFGSLGKGGRYAGLRCHLITEDNEFYLAHLSKFVAGLKPGIELRQGDLIGYSGSANGVDHLHIGMKRLILISNFK